jgi:hypothetical protein
MESRGQISAHVRSNVVGYVALFIALGGTAWAADKIGAGDIAGDAVRSKHIKREQVKRLDLAPGAVNDKKIRLPLVLQDEVDNLPGPPIVNRATLSVGNNGDGSALRITGSNSYGLHIENIAGADGIRVNDTGDDGIQMGSDPNYPSYGFYIPSPGVSTYGVWPNTAEPAGEWALFTVDKIEAGNVAAAAFTTVARAGAREELSPGEVVTADGVGAPVPGSVNELAALGEARQATPVIGVVASRMVFARAPGKTERAMRSAPGPAQSGDFVAVVTHGVADVALADGEAVSGGDMLGVAAGEATGEPAASTAAVGIALGPPDGETGKLPVFVDPR